MKKLPEPMDVEDDLYDQSFTLNKWAPQEVKWLMPGYIPAAKVSLLVGEPGLGKFQLVTDLAARVTTGSPMPFCSQSRKPAGVLLLTMEDNLYDTVQPRLEAAGADLSRVRVFSGTAEGLIADSERLVTIADKYRADLIIFDPPYSPRAISECYQSIGKKATQKDTQNSLLYKNVRDILDDILAPNGTVLSFGWNSSGMGTKREYEIVEILLVCHGSAHNDTICVAERKI